MRKDSLVCSISSVVVGWAKSREWWEDCCTRESWSLSKCSLVVFISNINHLFHSIKPYCVSQPYHLVSKHRFLGCHGNKESGRKNQSNGRADCKGLRRNGSNKGGFAEIGPFRDLGRFNDGETVIVRADGTNDAEMRKFRQVIKLI